MAKTLTVTDEAVTRTAEKYPHAKEVLREMFPEAFEPENALKRLNLSEDVGWVLQTRTGLRLYHTDGNAIIWIRGDGEFKGLGFGLHDKVDWEIKTDEAGVKVLTPTLK